MIYVIFKDALYQLGGVSFAVKFLCDKIFELKLNSPSFIAHEMSFTLNVVLKFRKSYMGSGQTVKAHKEFSDIFFFFFETW